ncbi:hypothetical protein C8R43DRAFT_1103773 [Mycena crocata]|nr:hypothetical protein C8R43DRAFT_1103773 [Mycena crocata]
MACCHWYWRDLLATSLASSAPPNDYHRETYSWEKDELRLLGSVCETFGRIKIATITWQPVEGCCRVSGAANVFLLPILLTFEKGRKRWPFNRVLPPHFLEIRRDPRGSSIGTYFQTLADGRMDPARPCYDYWNEAVDAGCPPKAIRESDLSGRRASSWSGIKPVGIIRYAKTFRFIIFYSCVRPFFGRLKTQPDTLRPDEFASRSVSPAGSFYRDGLRPQELPARSVSPAGSFYSHSSSSTPSIVSASSSGSRQEPSSPPSFPPATSWLARSPRTPPSLKIFSPTAAEFPSPPDTPMDVPEAELRRRQLEKATRILGESVPLELVFQPRHPLVKAFPDPPPRRSTESPQPGQQPREMLTERRAGKIARRASLSLSTFTSKFRSNSTTHSRDSSQESQSTSSSDQSQQSHSRRPPSSPSALMRSLPRRRSVVATSPTTTSPIVFSFPSFRAPSRSQTLPQPTTPTTPGGGPIIDIRSPESSGNGHDDPEATPIREQPPRLARSHSYSHSEMLPRIVPMPAHNHIHADSEQLYSRPVTPFADYTRPVTPFAEYARPETPFADLDPVEPAPNDFLSPVSRKERGQGWSGEWNQRDMQDVIQKLRSLK